MCVCLHTHTDTRMYTGRWGWRRQGFKSRAGDLKRGFARQISCHPITECSFKAWRSGADAATLKHQQLLLSCRDPASTAAPPISQKPSSHHSRYIRMRLLRRRETAMPFGSFRQKRDRQQAPSDHLDPEGRCVLRDSPVFKKQAKLCWKT